MEEKLSREAIEEKLEKMPDWHYNIENKTISKVFTLSSFTDSMTFAGEVAHLAEKENHHPEITINFDKVLVLLTTHDTGGVTGKDIDLAKKIEERGK